MTGTGVHLFKIPNAAFCLPSSVTLQSTKESTCVWKLGWNTLSFLFYINVKSRKIELSSIFYQKRRARSFPRSEIFSEGRVDATRVLIFSSALRKFTYAISSHIRLNTLLWNILYFLLLNISIKIFLFFINIYSFTARERDDMTSK